MGYNDHTYSVLDKTEVQTVSLIDQRRMTNHQVQVVLSAAPTAGTLYVQLKTPGAPDWVSVGSIDLTDSDEYVMRFEANAESIRFVPVSLDSDKTFSVYGYVS